MILLKTKIALLLICSLNIVCAETVFSQVSQAPLANNKIAVKDSYQEWKNPSPQITFHDMDTEIFNKEMYRRNEIIKSSAKSNIKPMVILFTREGYKQTDMQTFTIVVEATKYKDQIDFYAIDVDENPELVMQLRAQYLNSILLITKDAEAFYLGPYSFSKYGQIFSLLTHDAEFDWENADFSQEKIVVSPKKNTAQLAVPNSQYWPKFNF